jgi:hypothetical protein
VKAATAAMFHQKTKKKMVLLVTEKWKLFEHSIKLIISKWPAFQTVLQESTWLEKEQELFELTLEYFQETKVEPTELQENLQEFVEYTFGAEFEDDSYKLISNDICSLFGNIMNDQMGLYEELVKFADGTITLLGSVDPDSGTDQDVEEDEDVVVEPKPIKQEKIIDEDGFELVQKKKR